MRPAVRSIILSQVCLYAGLVVCIAMKPAGMGTNNGISYYGIYRETFFPYAVGLLGAAYFAIRAIDHLPTDEKVVQQSLKLYAPLVVGIVITPYAVGRWMDYLHTICGATLFSLQLGLSCWLVWRLRYTWWGMVLICVQLLAGVASAIYLKPPQGFLLQSQVLFQLAFGTLLVFGLQRLATLSHVETG